MLFDPLAAWGRSYPHRPWRGRDGDIVEPPTRSCGGGIIAGQRHRREQARPIRMGFVPRNQSTSGQKPPRCFVGNVGRRRRNLRGPEQSSDLAGREEIPPPQAESAPRTP